MPTRTYPAISTASALGWLERAALSVRDLRDPRVIRVALAALVVRLDGRRAAANTIARKRAVFHNALAYAVELGLLPSASWGGSRAPVQQPAWEA